MPSINRIRVNNVKYNFGTQEYDDFTMRLYGQNTLYDLANGGGKSVLMLLLMQCMIPNCTLDEKQPLEKLFRDNCGNGTIHSLIEWKLDPGSISDGFRYMTTGFCARKARDRGEEAQREVASVEYFNYCIFYQEYGKHDIVNLPLSDGENRMTYQALKNYLHDLARRENRLKVFIFDRKGEYQRFISRYGIIESHWEIIRGINKTEGHVRTYFETNYRTTRKVVEDLLIEEIIEKAYMVKTEQEEQRENSAASLLMSIREQLRELAEKKKDITTFDHEAELIRLLSDRIQSFGGLYGEREEVLRAIAGIYLTLDGLNGQREKEQERLQAASDQAEAEADAARAEVENLKTARLQREYEEKEQELLKKQGALQRDLEMNRAEERSLSYRRAELDFLTLKEEQQKLDTLTAEENAEVPEEIAPVIAGIREHFRGEKERLEKKIRETEKQLEKLLSGGAEERKTLTDARIELAILQHEESSLAVDRKGFMDRRELLLGKLSEQSLQPLEERIRQLRTAKDRGEGEILRLQQEIAFGEEEEEGLLRELMEKRQQAEKMQKALEIREEKREVREARQKRIAEIRRIYHADEVEAAGTGDVTGTRMPGKNRPEQADSAAAAEAVYRKLTRDMVRLSELERELLRLEKRREEIREGRWIQISAGVEAVLSYISTRHGVSAMFGMDFLAQLPKQEREKLLFACPELPYGIVAREYEQLLEDTRLGSMEIGGELVRIYNWDTLTEMNREVSEDHFTVRHSEAFFLAEDTEQKLLQSLKEVTANKRTERDYLKDAVETERRDLEFLLAEPEETEEPVTREQAEAAGLAAEELEKALESGRRARLDQAGRLAELEDAQAGYAADLEILKELSTLERQEEDAKEQLKELRRTRQNLEMTILNLEGNDGLREQEKTSLQAALQKLEESLTVLRVTWQEQYAAYEGYSDKESSAADPSIRDLSIEELEARFRRWKQGQEAAEEVLRQRRLLKQAIEGGIYRLKRSIADRRVELEDLEKSYAEGRLLPGEPEQLRDREEAFQDKQRELEELRERLAVEAAEVQKLAGSIEYAIENIRNAFGDYRGSDADLESLKRLIPAAEEQKKAAAQRLTEARENLKAFRKQSQDWEGLYREAGRIVERNRIDLSKAECCSSDTDLQREFEELLLRLDRNEKNIERARSQMLRTKGQVTQSLMDLGAASLSITIRDDAELPADREEAESLTERLSGMEELIRLERSRVEEGLSDMEKLKENFVEQCLERCLDVRTELEKLPRLSQIRMEDQPIQMVRLSIPYVKDEFLRQRMAEYIDHIVSEADSRKTEEEQHKYLQSELALKRLFGVIVTDMNKIRLQLYKRERMKEQSRYLRYEEAVGSTGQSQGIYIQFLVSVINYIAGMYTMQDTDRQTKTIFIDNPFGAAKDIYIWEPIFALLSANHVQLIVPSRGATPEITGRFDVNYVLGQQMAEGRAITVVTRYSSRSDEESTEYKELSYEQATFDFI